MCLYTLRDDKKGKRSTQQIVEYVLQEKGIYLVEGVNRVLDESVCQNNADLVFSFTEVSWACRIHQGEPDHLIWETMPVERGGDEDVVFLLELAMGYGSPIPQPSGRFDIHVNGKKVLSFCVSKSNRLWQGIEGVSLFYQVKLLKAAMPGYGLILDKQIVNESMASFGLGYLRIPRRLLQIGQPARLEVLPINRNDSMRWFRLGKVDDLISMVDLKVGVEIITAGRTVPALGEYQVYFGDIHSHSAVSDKLGDERGCGTGTREENFEYARDISCLDIYSLSEHDWQMNNMDWQNLQEITDHYYQAGKFVTLHSFEWTSQSYGHRNIYYLQKGGQFFASDFTGRQNTIDDRNPSPQQLWEVLDRQGMPAITIPHHTTSCFFPLSLFDYYNPKYDRLLEIYSSWANAEVAGNPFTEGDDKYACLHAMNFLNSGFRFGFVASSDGHDACPGNAQSPHHKPGYRALYHYLGSGRVAVLAKELTREAVFDALVQRRCYATTGEHIVLDFNLDGFLMGSELSVTQLSQQPRLVVEAQGTARIARLEICRNGHYIAQQSGSSVKEKLEWVDEMFNPREENYYYARVIQEDGEIAWASPIWVSPEF
jgi:hypothetical protein